MEKIDVKILLEQLNTFARDRDWDQFHSVKNLTTALMVEAGELAELFQWQTEEQSNLAHRAPEQKMKIEAELADVFGYLLRVADKCNVDLGAALLAKIQSNAEKYPVPLARGNATKYTDFKSGS
jgi:dCTP diphosphatase